MTQWYVPYNEIKPLPNAEGVPGVFIWQAFPWLKQFYLDVEINYSGVRYWQAKEREFWWVPIVTVIGYMIFIFGGQKVMASRKAFDLKGPLAFWNLLLSVFSWWGAFRTVPYLFYWLANISFHDLNCLNPAITHGERDVGLALVLFAGSKFLELTDTVFIVLRKKPLMFLHWYHHVTVLLFTYFSTAHNYPGLFFCAINYCVHAVMYGYFYLMAIKSVPKWFNPLWITIAQISQMFVGIYISFYQGINTFRGNCESCNPYVALGSLAMYSSYAYLFVEFAVKRFIIKPRQHKLKREESIRKKLPPPAPIPRLVQTASYSFHEFAAEEVDAAVGKKTK